MSSLRLIENDSYGRVRKKSNHRHTPAEAPATKAARRRLGATTRTTTATMIRARARARAALVTWARNGTREAAAAGGATTARTPGMCLARLGTRRRRPIQPPG